MKAMYLTSLTAKINPFSTNSKVPRLFIALLPSNAHKILKMNVTQLPRASTAPALLELGFKDGKTMKWSWGGVAEKPVEGKREEKVGLQDVVEEVERHTRQLGRKEELSG